MATGERIEALQGTVPVSVSGAREGEVFHGPGETVQAINVGL
jgi:hypothetical protein